MPETNSDSTERARRIPLTIVSAWLFWVGIPIVAIALGTCLVVRNWATAAPDYVVRYVFGEREFGSAPPDPELADGIRETIVKDWAFIAGYFLILLVCGLVFMAIISQFSTMGAKLSRIILGA